jgi:hypothetical protein
MVRWGGEQATGRPGAQASGGGKRSCHDDDGHERQAEHAGKNELGDVFAVAEHLGEGDRHGADGAKGDRHRAHGLRTFGRPPLRLPH